MICILKFYFHYKRKARYPVLMQEEILGYYKDIKIAENYLRNGLNNNEIGYEDLRTEQNKNGIVPLLFIIEKCLMDVFPYYCCKRYYNEHGDFQGETLSDSEESEKSFYGVDTEKCKFKEGDFVQFYQPRGGKGPELEAGIVLNQPFSKKYIAKTFKVLEQMENTYYIVDSRDHVHLYESQLMPVNADMLSGKMKERLLKKRDMMLKRQA